MVTDNTPQTYEEQRDAFVDRIFTASLGTFDIFAVFIGSKLNFYKALASNGSMTSGQLAEQTHTAERYTREWLEQQTVSGILTVSDESLPGQERQFSLPAAHAEVLVDEESLNYLTPLAHLITGAVHPMPALLEAYKTGKGISYSSYGEELREGQAAMNRPMFLKQLGFEWLPSINDVHQRLQADPPARIADIGCGFGWSAIGMARAYPKVRVEGFDLDESSVEAARVKVRQEGLEDRVRIHLKDAADPEFSGYFDLVTAFECVHDMSDPVAALRTMLGMVGRQGAVIIMDERVQDRFKAEAGDVERMMYGWSFLHCLPVGMEEKPSAATGTVMRADTLRQYAAQAGFCDVEVLPIDNFFFRFYRLKAICPK